MLPLVNRTSKALSGWLAPAYGAPIDLRPDLDAIEALATEREALWARIDKATFLTLNEKRAATGRNNSASGRAPRSTLCRHPGPARVEYASGNGPGPRRASENSASAILNDTPPHFTHSPQAGRGLG